MDDSASAPVLARFWAQAEACTPQVRVANYTQAIMDLGATLCTRSRPACTVCPMQGHCVAAREGRQGELPGKKRKRARTARQAVLLIAETTGRQGPAVLLEKRPASGIWGGLWSPPQFDDEAAALAWCRCELGEAAIAIAAGAPDRLAPIEHAFTHFDLTLKPLRVRCTEGAAVNDGDARVWYPLRAPLRVGLPQPIRRLLADLVTE